jgi:hypothetical protein
LLTRVRLVGAGRPPDELRKEIKELAGEYREEVIYEQGVKNENQKNRLAEMLDL